MFQVSQSATGQFVVIHPASDTVMVGDDLAATYERMRTFVAGLGEAAVKAAPPPSLGARLGSSAAHWVLLAALALLPFVWLGALHVSLGRLVAELRVAPPAGNKEQPGADLRARVERVERQIETIERPPGRTPGAEIQADRVEQQAEQVDDGPEPEKTAGEADKADDKAGADVGVRPGAAKPGADKPGAAKPGAAKPGSDRPRGDRAGADRPGSAPR